MLNVLIAEIIFQINQNSALYADISRLFSVNAQTVVKTCHPMPGSAPSVDIRQMKNQHPDFAHSARQKICQELRFVINAVKNWADYGIHY